MVNKLYKQFGNRTIAVANTISKTDFKALSHSKRIALEVKELLETKFIKFPLKDADELREIKLGNCNVSEVIEDIEDILAEVDILLLSTDLPQEVDEELMNKIILDFLDYYFED